MSGPYRTFRRLIAEESYLEFEGSTITIPMRGRRPQGPWMEEEIKLNAFMRLEIFPAYFNNLGTREFQFIIRDWYLYGKSPMLNELFFDDPRGRWVPPSEEENRRHDAGFVPAVVTFNVSNNFETTVFSGPSSESVFASPTGLEIHGLTSQHLRPWVVDPEFEVRQHDLPRNAIFWQVAPNADALFRAMSSPPKGDGVKSDDVRRALETGRDCLTRSLGEAGLSDPLVIFHNKPPVMSRSQAPRDVFGHSAEDWAQHLLAIGSLAATDRQTGARPPSFVARERQPGSGGGLAASRVQLWGNTVISPLARPKQPLEIRWAMAGKDTAKSLKQVQTGQLRIVSPPRSLGTADQGPDLGRPDDSADFPARITYATNYNIAVNDTPFVEDQAGIAIAVGAEEIPPRDVTVAFDKPHIGAVLNSFLEFGSGHCTGMHEITQDEYLHNVNFARYWRTVPLDNNSSDWNTFQDFDLTRSY